jgi:hypothetical protein
MGNLLAWAILSLNTLATFVSKLDSTWQTSLN